MASDELRAFLGPAASGLLDVISTPGAPQPIVPALESCARTLKMLDQLDLSPHELADLETPNVATWEALAPEVRNMLVAVRATCDEVVALFPAGPDEASAVSAELVDPFSDERSGVIDGIVQGSTGASAASLGGSVSMLADVLRRDILAFGTELRNPQIVGDRWFLLGEVHQFIGQCVQCVEAIAATVLTSISGDDLSVLLPRYSDYTRRNLNLRQAVVDLSYDLVAFNEAMARSTLQDPRVLRNGLKARLVLFSESPAYKLMKPQDKRAVILFRIFLNNWDPAKQEPASLRQETEGFAKFLSLLCDIGWRDALMEHDRRLLGELAEMLEAGAALETMQAHLNALYGSFEPLDQLLRGMKKRVVPSYADLVQAVATARARHGFH